ncbi:addiction module protein [Duganella aceris]|uniref:Addiction module protein n=1 Tax=Duganella aceris TaxID=2703883 RepID=A0ABX0FN95_9BURK|nr:addiction module protein [Duganella aceris]NGZ86095.1 addiction module protein [Duganella aceris]
MKDDLLHQVAELTVEDQLALVEAIWDGIVHDDAASLPTEAHKAELDQLLAEHEANADHVLSWDEVEAAALARMRQ